MTRVPPRVVAMLPLEGVARILLICESFEDERRLRMWLRTSAAFESLPALLARLLDDLDQLDAEGEDAA